MAMPRRTESQYAVIRALTAYRQQIGMSLTQCARRMGCDRSQVSQIETGNRAPNMVNLFKYAAALGLEFKLQVKEHVEIDPLKDSKGRPGNPEFPTAYPKPPGTVVTRVRFEENNSPPTRSDRPNSKARELGNKAS